MLKSCWSRGNGFRFSPSASADSGSLLSLGRVVGVLREASVKMDTSVAQNMVFSRPLYLAFLSVNGNSTSKHTSLAAFRFLSPLAPSAAFFFSGRVGLTSPGSKTSSGRLQLRSLVSLRRLQQMPTLVPETYFLTCWILRAQESWSSLSYLSQAKQRFLKSLTS